MLSGCPSADLALRWPEPHLAALHQLLLGRRVLVGHGCVLGGGDGLCGCSRSLLGCNLGGGWRDRERRWTRVLVCKHTHTHTDIHPSTKGGHRTAIRKGAPGADSTLSAPLNPNLAESWCLPLVYVAWDKWKREAGLSVQVLVFIFLSTKDRGQVPRPYGTDKQHQA